MADLDLIVNTKSVVDALGQVRKLEGQIKALTDRFVRGSVDQQTYAKGLLEIKREYTQIGVSSQKASGQVDKLAKSFRSNSTEVERLRNKYNPLYAASKRYEVALEEINQANRIGALTDKQREAALESLHMEYAAGTGRFAQYNAAMVASTRGMNRTGVVMQQTGYQVGDFLVQVQSGTNAFVAFGQQATQLAGLLTMSMNPKLIALGAALSIVIPLLTAGAAAFMRTRDEANSASDSAQKLADDIQALDQSLQAYDDTVKAASRGITVDELFATSEIERARSELERLQTVLDETTSASLTSWRAILATTVDALPLSRFLGFSTEGVKSDVEEAEAILEEARERLARLQERLDEEAAQRQQAFAMQEEASLRDQIQLLQVQLQYGEDSIEVEKTRQEQARQAFLLEVMREGIYGEQLARLTEMYDEYVKLNEIAAMPVYGPELPDGFGDNDDDTGRGRRTTQSINEIIAARQKQLDQEQELLEISRDRAAARAIEFELENQYQGEVTETMREQIQAAAESMAAQEEQIRKLEEIRDRNKEVADTIADSFGKAFTSIMDGTKSTSEAFKDMARQIIAELYQIYVVKQITGFISQAIDGFLAGGGGGGAKGGGKASGGYMMANTPYLVGENGPELVVPSRQSTIMNADLTQKAIGSGGGETIVVNQTINVSTGVQQTVRNEIQNLMPQISEAAKSAVVDAKRRGGSYGRAFG